MAGLEGIALYCLVSFILGGFFSLFTVYWLLVKIDESGQLAQIILQLPRNRKSQWFDDVTRPEASSILKRSRKRTGRSNSVNETAVESVSATSEPELLKVTNGPEALSRSLSAASDISGPYKKIEVDVSILLSGYLQMKTLPGVFQKRWFELSSDGWLSFYKRKHIDCMGHIKLKGCVLSIKGNTSKGKYIFEISQPNPKRPLYRANKKRSIVIQGEKEHLTTEKTTTAGSILLKTHLKRCTLKAANDAELQEWTNAIREAITKTTGSMPCDRQRLSVSDVTDENDLEETPSSYPSSPILSPRSTKEPTEDEETIEHFKREVADVWDGTKFDDADCERFLRARQMDVKKASSMFKQYARWRIDEGIDSLSVEDVQSEIRKQKLLLHGFDNHGQPTIVVYPGRHIPKESDPGTCLKLAVFIIEAAIRNMPNDVSKFAVVCDCKEFSLGKMDHTLTKMGVAVLQNYYPERLGAVYVINQPLVISVVWKFIKPLLDPSTREKVHFLSSKKDLLNFFLPEQLLEHMGGSSTKVYEDLDYGLDTLQKPISL